MALTARPSLLAGGLNNAVEFSTNKKGLEVNDSIYVAWTGETLRFMGRGRYSGCVYDLAASSYDDEPPWNVIVSLDTAKEAATALRKSPGAGRKDTTVDIVRLDDGSIHFMAGTEAIAILQNAPGHENLRSSDEFEGFYEKLERISEWPAEEIPPASPIVFTRDVVAKLGKLKTDLPNRDEDRWELHYIGGATWIYRYMGEFAAAAVMLESCRDSLD